MTAVIQQKKKDPNDPDVDQINPDLVKAARHIGFMKQPMMLFLHGDLTWRETLETMVMLMSKEYAEQKKILIEALQDRGPVAILALPPGLQRELRKALPARPITGAGPALVPSPVPPDGAAAAAEATVAG